MTSLLQSQTFRARADPLAGTDFARRVVIILRQVLVEVTLGTGQIFLRDGSEHTQSGYRIPGPGKCASHSICISANSVMPRSLPESFPARV